MKAEDYRIEFCPCCVCTIEYYGSIAPCPYECTGVVDDEFLFITNRAI